MPVRMQYRKSVRDRQFRGDHLSIVGLESLKGQTPRVLLRRDIEISRCFQLSCSVGVRTSRRRIQELPDRVCQNVRSKRFLQERGLMLFQSNIDADVVEISGHEQDFEVRINQMQAARQFPSIHGRHDHVGQQQVELAALLGCDQTGFNAVCGFYDVVSDFRELVANQVPHELLVLHDQYSFAAASNFLMMVAGLARRVFPD